MSRQVRNITVLAGAIGLPILVEYLARALGWSEYTQAILFRVGLNVTLAVSLSLIIGFAGQFSLGQAGFMSVGAFFSGWFTSVVVGRLASSFDAALLDGDGMSAVGLRAGFLLLSLVVGVVAAIVASVLIGLPALRLRGDYLAIATLGFGEITYNLLLIHLQASHHDTAYYMPYTVGFMSKTANVASSWILALLAILVVRNLLSSTAGRGLPAIREDEIAASAVGIRTTRFKLIAFVVGSALAGGAGVLEAQLTQTVNPASYRFDRSIEMIVPVVLGGSGSLTGSVVSAVVFTYIVEWLRGLPSDAQQYRTIVYSSVLILVMILRPQGLLGRFELGDLFARRRKRKEAQAAAAVRDEAPSALVLDGAQPVRLECSNLGIRFGGLSAVNNFNLCLQPGEILGLIGPNGAGKTTCFNMITGIYRPTSGDIRLDGRSIVGVGCAATNNLGISRTFQNIRLFSDLTVRDNVRIALHAHVRTGLTSAIFRTAAFYRDEARTHVRTDQLLDLFGLGRLGDELSRNLCYGDQRRLEIARALATRPRILCLDEPAAGLNPVEKKALMDLIRLIRDRFRLTVLLIEHDMKVVMGVCERIVVLDHGETIAEGRPAAIRTNPKVIEAYLGEPGAAG